MVEQFAEGTTILHRMESRPKLISACFFIVPAAMTDRFESAFMYLLIALMFATLSRLPLKKVLKRLALVNSFTLFLLITLPLTFGGDQVFLPFGISFSKEGIRVALLILVKTNAILTAIMALLSTSTISSLGQGLEKSGLPTRLCYLLLFSYRYISVIEQEFKRLLRAAKMRNFVPSTSAHTYRTYGYLFGMTLVKSWDHAHRIHQAMVLRGFTGHFVSLRRPDTISAGGYLLIVATALSCFAIFAWEHHTLFSVSLFSPEPS